ncbi:MAG: outer membrane lipoprotein chaperone LolA, partial [Perlucidibaca sp.]
TSCGAEGEFFDQALADAGGDLAQRLQALKSLQADFVQTTQSPARQAPGGRRSETVSGSLAARKPGLFRWEVQQPYQQLIVSDGKEVRVHDPDLQQMTIKPLSQEWGQTPALLFSGDARALAKQFAVARRDTGSLTEFVLTPKARDAVFAAVSLQFKGKTPFAMDLQDSMGQKTHVEFTGVRVNAAIADSQFRFTPPAGTDIIRE